MADFPKAVLYVLHNEDSTLSGSVITDSGGRTRFGIAERFHPNLGDAFYLAPVEVALKQAQDIYRAEYWPGIHGDEITNDAVGAKILDLEVDMGAEGSTKVVQNACTQCGLITTPDGCFGHSTLRNVNTVHPVDLLLALANQAAIRYRHIALDNPKEAVDLKGWLNRAYKVPKFSDAANV